ncbi:MAG: DUF2249 domain-containing protein [Streptosporangiaceae bacterium]
MGPSTSRPHAAAGGEPFGTIMAAVAALADGEELVVLAPFEPVPLEGVLGSQGFSYHDADRCRRAFLRRRRRPCGRAAEHSIPDDVRVVWDPPWSPR